MTRVRQVVEHPGTIVREHQFENWPVGTHPHTTAPFDDLTAGLALALRPVTADPVNLAGALVSLLIGVFTTLFLWIWMGRLELPYRFPSILLFATSPVLVHGTVLGRPDHQSLLILCMAVAVGSEVVLMRQRSLGWELTNGLAWGIGFWVSLYEPVLLFLAVAILRLSLKPGREDDGCQDQHANNSRKRISAWRTRIFSMPFPTRWAALCGVLLLATLIDGWQSPVPEPEVVKFFPNWSLSIGELGHASFLTLLRWSCALLPLSAALFVFARDKRAYFWLALVALTAGLSVWELRWGYFFGVFFAMSLPWQLSGLEQFLSRLFKRENLSWLALALFAVSLWPVASEWSGWLFPSRAERARRDEVRSDNVDLFNLAQRLHVPRLIPVLAPWWQSPAIAYWSGQPCVAGSSHESLPGTVDTARFFLCEDPAAAEAILVRRKVACVVAYEPDRVIETSSIILEGKARPGTGFGGALELGDEAEKAMGVLLFRRPHSAPPYLKLVDANTTTGFRVFIRPGGLEPNDRTAPRD
jgi:hypothetical protein